MAGGAASRGRGLDGSQGRRDRGGEERAAEARGGVGARRASEPLAHVALASRCPRLRSLSLTEFDFGIFPGEELGPLATLGLVEELTLEDVDEWARCLLVLRTPNVQKLTISNSDLGPTLHPEINLPTLRHLTYRDPSYPCPPLGFTHSRRPC